MLKECTILTFNETERLRQDLDSLIETLKDGENGKDDPKNACCWEIEEAREIRKLFD